MKVTAIVVFIIGLLILWTGLNGTFGTLLASVFVPNKVEDEEKKDE